MKLPTGYAACHSTVRVTCNAACSRNSGTWENKNKQTT